MAFPRPYGRYVLEERLAMGGMAEIFRARMSTAGFEKRLCIKRILPHYLEQEDFVTMFRDEAALAARLQHANIVQVFDFGTEEEALYLAMELVDGADLRRLMNIAAKQGRRFGLGHAVQIAIEVCRGLHHAHTLLGDDGEPLGIVHRDISPHNILVSRAGEVKVTDFGIAKASARATHTGTGVVKGKLAYMAPEQANSRPFDHRLDQFATGVVLWEMICGERLFSGEDEVSILRKVMSCKVPSPATLLQGFPEALERVLMKILAEDPEDRFSDMRETEHALTRCLFEITSEPEESNVRSLVETLLLSPENSRRHTAILVENPVLSAPGEESEIPSLSKAGFSEVFERPPAASGHSGRTIAAALEAGGADSSAATRIRDEGASAPAPPSPPAQVPLEHTGVTRTAAPSAPLPTPAPSPPPAVSPSPPRAPPSTRRAPLVAAGLALASLVVVGGVVLALGGDEPAVGSDEVTVARAEPPPPTPEPEPVPEAEATAPLAAPALEEPASEEPAPAEEEEEDPPEAPEPPAATAAKQPEAAQPAAAQPQRRRAQSPSPAGARAKGRVYIEMASGWATAYLGKRRLCDTPCAVQLPAGSHLLRLVSGDGSERRQRVSVKPGATVRAVVP